MGYEFEGRTQAELDATPEQVWEAIATGPGIDSWFMGRNEVEPGAHGTVRMAFGGYSPTFPVTTWDPPQRFAYRTDTEADGRFVAYEFLIEGREQSSTVVRMVTSGFLPGDDWEAEYEAMTKGNALFFRTLIEYLSHFPGRQAAPVTAFGPPVTDWDRAWAALHGALGLTGPATEGDLVRLTAETGTPIEGVVYFVNSDTLGVRTADALCRFLKGFRGPMIASHHVFSGLSDSEEENLEQAWQSWLERVLA